MLSESISHQVAFVLNVLANHKSMGNTISPPVDSSVLELITELNTTVDLVTDSRSFLFALRLHKTYKSKY